MLQLLIVKKLRTENANPTSRKKRSSQSEAASFALEGLVVDPSRGSESNTLQRPWEGRAGIRGS